jgi:DNA-binding CsgD family transcriptional regulator
VTEVIGREEELVRIESWLDGPRPAALLIEGEAGIGKTTLWRSAVARAEQRGNRLLTCALAESEARLAFAGLSDLVRSHLADALPSLARPQARALEEALLLRETPEGLPDERAVAFGFLGLVTELCRRAPLAIAIDDLQWLDASSLAVLRYSVRRLGTEPIALVFARRIETGNDRDPFGLTSGLDELERIELGPLTLGALHRLLRMRLGHPLTRPVLSRLHAASSGNPLHAIELARSIDPEHPDYQGSLARILHMRVAALPAETRIALALAAASSDPSVPLLSRAYGRDILPALEPAVEADLVSIEDDRVRFGHPAVASAAEEIVGEGAQEIHRALAAVSESLEDRARHLGRATTEPSEDVAEALEEAAREVRGRGARSVAAELFEASARLTPAAGEDDRGRRMLSAAHATFEAGDTPHAEELLSALVSELPEGDLRSEASWRLGTVLDETGRWRDAMALWTDARRSTTSARFRAEISRSMAITTAYTGTASDATRFAIEGVGAAETSGDSLQLAYALAARAFVAVVAGDEDFRPAIERALALEGGIEGGFGEWSPTAVAAECARHTGDVEDARRHYAAVLDRAVERGDASIEQWAAYGLASVDLLAGDLARADRLADVVLDLAEQTGVMQIPARILRAHVDAHLGKIENARELLAIAAARAEAEDEPAHLYNTCVVAGLVSMCEDDAAAAAAHYGRAHELAAKLGFAHATALRSYLYEAEAAAAAGSKEQADAALAAFDRAGSARAPAWSAVVYGRARAARRAADGDLDAAEQLLQQSLDADDGLMPIERGRALLLLGTVRRRARKRKASRLVLDEALAVFQEVGAAAWSGQASAELERMGGADTTRGELTPTEHRVAQLVADGKRNKEVAAALFLSVKTVEVTLTRVYRKLGVRSRTELARRAADFTKP